MPLREQVYKAAREASPYPVTAEQWFARASNAIDTLLRVEAESVRETAAHTTSLVARARRNYLVWAALGVLGFLAVALCVIILEKRVLAPLRALTVTMASLAKGDLRAVVPRHPRRDELGAMAHALRRLKTAALQAQRLRAAKERAERQALQAIRDREVGLRAIFDSVSEGIVTVAADGRVEAANPAAGMLFGCPFEQLVGQSVLTLVPEPEAARYETPVLHYLATGRSDLLGVPQEVAGIRCDGSPVQLEVTVAEARLADRSVFTASLRDITERRRVERMKSEFVSTVSHELRTPLTSIRGSLSLLLGLFGSELKGQARLMVEMAHRNAERLIALVNDILDIEKLESGRLEFAFRPLDLVALAREAVETNQSFAAERGVTLRLASAPAELRVSGDPGRLLQVMANLLSNAAKFSEPGAAVTVEVSQEEQGVARVTVHDTGPGVPDEFRSRIFQKFAQADGGDARKEGGTGLGLSICKAIVERHGGQIGFESRPGATRFFFTVPSLGKSVSDDTKAERTRGRILVCEDDVDTARLLRLMIEREGFAVEIAPTIATAREMLLACKDGYAAVTVDLSLPDGSGLDLVRELQGGGRHADLPVIVISASAAEGRRVLNGDAVGVIGWLDKPFDDRALEAALRRAVRGKGADTARVLYVEDDPELLAHAGRLLQGRASLVTASSAAEALDRAKGREQPFDVVILGLTLLRADTLEPDLLLRLRELPGPPAVMILAASDIDETGVEEELRKVLSRSLRTTDRELIPRMLQLIGAEG